MNTSSRVLIALLILAAALHLSVVRQDFSTLAKNGFLYDDSFYAFQIARSIAEGKGASFDGVVPTNGFQPLYVLLLVPLERLFPDNPVPPVYCALALMAFLTVASAFLLFCLLSRYVRRGVALAGAGLWVLAPVVMRQTANGLETALAAFFFVASVYYYVSRIRRPEATRGQFARMGLLLALAMLSRVDEALMALALALDYLLYLRAAGRTRHALRGPVLALSVLAVTYAPWMVYGMVSVGSPMQESGKATRFLSMAYAPFFGLGSHTMMYDGPDATFIWAHVTRSVSVMKVNPLTHLFFRAMEKAGVPAQAADALGLAMLAAFVVWALWRTRRREVRELRLLLVFSAAMVVVYSLYVFGVFFYLRYYYPLFIVGVVFSAILIDDVVSFVQGRGLALRRALATAAAVYAVGTFAMTVTTAFFSKPVYHFYDIAEWVKENTDPGITIGAFQSGAIGYLSGRRVVNLDGKVNGRALRALKAGRLAEYVADAHVDVIMDHTRVLNLFLGPWDESDYRSIAARQMFTAERFGAAGWIGYRVAHANRALSSAVSPASPARRVGMQPRD